MLTADPERRRCPLAAAEASAHASDRPGGQAAAVAGVRRLVVDDHPAGVVLASAIPAAPPIVKMAGIRTMRGPVRCRRSPPRPRRLDCGILGAALVVGWLALGPSQAGADVLHVYDRLHRLRATVDPAANDAAVWAYDAVGNILSITRQPATQTTILELPADAVAGACGVRILGIGFSPTPAQNTVTIGGVAAAVQSATATALVLCVGAGTTTGPVAVTTPTGSDTSAAPLTVRATAAIPTITSVTPGVAVWGTTLSVSGTSFDPGFGRTRLRMGGSRLLAPVASVTPTALSTTVGPGTTSGRLTVTTPAGTATAAADLFVPPAPYGASDVAITARWTVGTSQGLTIPASKQALLVFDGTVSQKVCVGQAYGSTPETTVYQPDGAILVPAAFYGDTVVEVPPLPVAGTYQIRLRNASSSTAYTGTTTLYDASDRTQGTIPTDGTATTLTFNASCYRASRTFAGTAGQRVSLAVTSTVNGSSALTLVSPDGSPLWSGTIPNSSGIFVEPLTLPQSGPYTWWGDPSGGSLGVLTLRLYDVVDVETPITPGGAPVTVTLTAPGQRAALTFSGTTGQRASVQLDSLQFGGSAWIADPTDAVVGPVQGFSPGQARFFETPAFSTAGTYRVMLDPTGDATGSARVTLWTYADVTASLTLGVATPVTLAAPGQRAVLSFAGTAGQRVSLQTSSPSGSLGSAMPISLLNPDGTTLLTTTLPLPGLSAPTTLPVAGTYTVILDPSGVNVGSLSLTLITPTELTIAWNGKIRDRVGPGSLALSPDGALDGTVTATVTGPTRTVQQLVQTMDGGALGMWATISGYWILGTAAGPDSGFLNAGDGSVSFAVTGGSTFVVFSSDTVSGVFLSGHTLTLTATFSDGTTAAAAVTIP